MKSAQTSLYKKYEALIIKRDELRKQADFYSHWYTRTFGDLVIQIFKEKMESVKKKKAIAYCQALINKGKSVDAKSLERYLKKELAPYRDRLEVLLQDYHKRSARLKNISDFELKAIKKLYCELVKLLHPDINPLANENADLQELWDRVVKAYKRNDIEELDKLKVLTIKALKELGYDVNLKLDIPDIESKITEIEVEIAEIQNNNPYKYKFLLEDSTGCEEKRTSLLSELESYQNYNMELETVLQNLKFAPQGSVTIQ